MKQKVGLVLRVIKVGVTKVLKLFALAVALIIGVDVLGAVTVGYPPTLVFVLHELPFRGERFEPVAWREAGSCAGLSDWECYEKEDDCPRGPMVRDLLRSHLEAGTKTRAQVVSVIGPSEADIRINGAICEGYRLGICSGFGWDYDSLYVCYGDDGTVSRAGHMQH